MNTSLVLGFGNYSKPILKVLEPVFLDHDFAVLDEWSTVQEVVVKEDPIDTNFGTQVCFVRDLSYFVDPPFVALRFEDSKYLDAQTQKMRRSVVEHRYLLRLQVPEALPVVIASLKQYQSIVMLGFSGAVLVAEFLLPLLQQLQAGTSVTVFTGQPARFEGTCISEMAVELRSQLLDADVRQYCFFRQDLANDYGQQTMSEFVEAAEQIQVDALRNILLHKPVTSQYISLE